MPGHCSRPILTTLFCTAMRLLLALLLPFSVFFTIGRPFAGLLCLILQITLIGWVPAARRSSVHWAIASKHSP